MFSSDDEVKSAVWKQLKSQTKNVYDKKKIHLKNVLTIGNYIEK